MRSYAIIPAAGASRRMGRSKLAMPWGNRPTLLEATLSAWIGSRVDTVVVVVRADDSTLQAACGRAGVECVRAVAPLPEMKDTVLAGLHHVSHQFHPADDDVWLLAPADMPLLTSAAIDSLVAAHRCEAPSILQLSIGERGGHPILLPWPFVRHVECLGPDEGINVILRRHPARLVPWHDEGILADVDTMDEYRRLAPPGTGKTDDASSGSHGA